MTVLTDTECPDDARIAQATLGFLLHGIQETSSPVPGRGLIKGHHW